MDQLVPQSTTSLCTGKIAVVEMSSKRLDYQSREFARGTRQRQVGMH